MISIPVFNNDGQEIDQIQIDEQLLGGRVRPALLKQALVRHHANNRQGSATTKSRGMVDGSTRKLYKQKGTGNARMGANRTVVRRGGGVAFAKKPRDFTLRMPKKQRRLARNSAILAKLQSSDAMVVDELKFSDPKTSRFVTLLQNLKIERSCLVAIEGYDDNVYKSLRNIPRINAVLVEQLNAGEICKHRTLLFTREAIESFFNSGNGGE